MNKRCTRCAYDDSHPATSSVDVTARIIVRNSESWWLPKAASNPAWAGTPAPAFEP